MIRIDIGVLKVFTGLAEAERIIAVLPNMEQLKIADPTKLAREVGISLHAAQRAVAWAEDFVPSPIELRQAELTEQRKLLSVYLLQLSKVGSAHASPQVIGGVRDARREIARIKLALSELGVEVSQHPDDTA